MLLRVDRSTGPVVGLTANMKIHMGAEVRVHFVHSPFGTALDKIGSLMFFAVRIRTFNES